MRTTGLVTPIDWNKCRTKIGAGEIESMYRTFFRGGDYADSAAAPALSDDVWAVVNLEILAGGDAYQALMATLQADR